jgi:preprotein translocase subunit SecE
MEKVKTFFHESRQELKKVNWPTRQETARYTMFVIVFSLVFAAYLGLLDFAFLEGLKQFFLR